MFHGSCFCNGRNPSSTLPIPCCFTSSLSQREYNTCSKRNKNFEQKAKQKEGKSKILSKGKPENKNVQNFTQKKLRKTEKIGKKQIKKIKQKNKKLREKNIFHLPKQPSRHFLLAGRPKLWRNAGFSPAEPTLSSLRMSKTVAKRKFSRREAILSLLRARRTSNTVAERKFFTLRSNLFVTSCSSDAQDCSKMVIFLWRELPRASVICFIHFRARCYSETCIFLNARRCSDMRILILLDEPSRRIRWVDRAKLSRNTIFIHFHTFVRMRL